MLASPRIRLFVGAPIQHDSEREVLGVAHQFLSQQSGWAFLLANFNASGRQLDLLIATADNTLVVEAKGYSFPVHGGLNGPWELEGPVRRRSIRSAYGQALDAKNSLRDLMQSYAPEVGYPDAAVCVSPRMPVGSKLTAGDFKVGVGSLVDLVNRLQECRGCKWDERSWERLVSDLGLQEVNSIDAATSQDLFDAGALVEKYQNAFSMYYGEDANRLVPDRYRSGEECIELEKISDLISQSRSILVEGPSGCGKSLLAKKLAMHSLQHGCVPIFLVAKAFDGTLRRAIQAEVSLLHAPSSRALLRAARLLEKTVLLIVDGYNECDEALAETLTRGIAAFSLRCDASVVITSQNLLARRDLISLTQVSVERPSMALKLAIAKIPFSDNAVDGRRALLDSVYSGFEAELVGQVGKDISDSASRFALYDAFVRLRFGVHASEAIRYLCAIARLLVQRASFILSIRELDRLIEDEGFQHHIHLQIERAQLLDRRADYVSFGHELYFAAFAAEAAIRSARGQPDRLLEALASPRYLASKTFIVGAIEDQVLLSIVLEAHPDADLYVAAIKGECGQEAEAWVKRRISGFLSKMTLEAQAIRFELGDSGWHGANICKDLVLFSPGELSPFLAAIAQDLSRGNNIQEVLAAVRCMDASIANCSLLLANEAREKKIPLRSAMFADAYVMSRATGVSQLLSFLHSGGLGFQRDASPSLKIKLENAWQIARSPGEFYLLIHLTKYAGGAACSARYVVGLFKEIKRLPYHLQLDLLDFAHYLRDAEEPWISQIIESLQASLDQLGVLMNTMIFEALEGLGALDEMEYAHQDVVKAEIEEVFVNSDEFSDQRAYNLFSCQFDHPYSSAYYEVIDALPSAEKKMLFTMAMRGAAEPHTFFLSLLIRRLTEFQGDDTAAAITPWTALPSKTSFMPQNSIEVFLEAHAALGILGAKLSHIGECPDTPAAEALLACGELTYWAERRDLSSAAIAEAVSVAQQVLFRQTQAAAGALLLTRSRLLDPEGKRKSLAPSYPDLSLAVCREALTHHEDQISYFGQGFMHGPTEIAQFSLEVIGKYGDRTDLVLVRRFVDDRDLGEAALTGIKMLEGRPR